jgi:hypothetical protein
MSLYGTSAVSEHNTPVHDDECGEMRIGRRNRITEGKLAPVPFGPPQFPHDLIWDQIQVAAMGIRRLIA